MAFRQFGLIAAGLLAMVTTANVFAQTAPLAPAAPALDPAKPISVNGKIIPKSRFDFIVRQQAAQGQPDNDQVRRNILDQLITREVLSQEAEKKGLGKSPEFQIQIEIARQGLLIDAYMQDHFKTHPIKDDQLLAEYNRVKASRGDREYKVRHILVDKETEARDIIAQLKKGAKFEDLAKRSKDPGSKDKGGDLAWNPASTYVKPFSDVLTKLEKGRYTEAPVQTQFGWHVIQLDDVRTSTFPEFNDVKTQLRTRVQQQEIQKIIRDLRAKAKIE